MLRRRHILEAVSGFPRTGFIGRSALQGNSILQLRPAFTNRGISGVTATVSTVTASQRLNLLYFRPITPALSN